jgi:hypothetical protein
MMINLSEREKLALSRVNKAELNKLIDEAISERSASGLSRLSLVECGDYVSTEFRYFQRALADYGGSKSTKKIERTHSDAIRAGYRLSSAVSQMIRRMQTEIEEGERFFVDDHIHWPYSFSKNLSVTVSYRWRSKPSSDWEHGRITFYHQYASNPDYRIDQPKRKLSARKQKEREQEEYARTWEHLRDLSLFAVRDYFREGGDGGEIPEKFRAIPDDYTKGLNNFSTKFWREQNDAKT